VDRTNAPWPEPSAKGLLATTPLAALLAEAHVRRYTGTLALASPRGARSFIVLAEGQLWKARAAEPGDYLGAIAYELGLIDTQQLDATLADIATSRGLHGAVLVSRGLLKPEELAHVLSVQTKRKVQRAFRSDASAYELLDGFDALEGWGGADWPFGDPRPAIWSGVREAPPLEHVRRAAEGAKGRQFRLVPSTNLGRLGLLEEEISLAECLRVRPMSVEDLRRTTLLDSARTDAFFYFLQLMGLLLPASERPVAQPPQPRSRPAPPTSGTMRRFPSDVPVPLASDGARRGFLAAYAAVTAGNLERAHDLCREALAADPEEADTVALAIWVDVLRAVEPAPDDVRRAIDALTRVVVRATRAEHAHFFRGQLQKRLGNAVQAARDFRRVLELNPERHDAEAELRLYAARRKKA
jgi:tetratricopeptide (TPR) repeat protein